MTRPVAVLTLLLLATPLVVAAGNEPLPEVDDPLPADPFAPVAAAASAAGDAAADAASTAARAIGTAVHAVGAALAAVGHTLVEAASAVGHALAATARALGAALTFLAGLAATAATALAGLFMDGARYAAAHPKESAIAGGAATATGGLVWLLKRFGFLAGIPLYTRLAPGEILENEARSRVYDAIRAQPGRHVSALAEDLGLGWGTITYHLARLESNKLVTPKTVHGRKCYFAVGSDLDAAGRTTVAALGSDPARRIVDAVRETPGITQKDLAATLGMSQALASWHVKRLVTAGVLEATRVGRSNALSVPGHVSGAMAAAAVLA